MRKRSTSTPAPTLPPTTMTTARAPPIGALPERPHFSTHWRDYYPAPPLSDDLVVPKPPSKIKLYNTQWKRDNPNPKSREGIKAYYGSNVGMAGMYPGMTMGCMGGMGMGGMYPGMGMGGMGMPYGGGMGMMGGGYGMPRYGGYGPGIYGGAYSNYGGYGGGMYDPMMGQYGAPPAANFVDDFPDAHRIEHAYRQSAPDSYGLGIGMMGGMGGGMGINNLPGSQVLLYGRGMPYNGWYA